MILAHSLKKLNDVVAVEIGGRSITGASASKAERETIK